VVRLEVCLKASRRAAMPKKRHKAEEIVAKLRQVDVLASQGVPIADAVRTQTAPTATLPLAPRPSLN
jgi:type II secretory pathway component PulF